MRQVAPPACPRCGNGDGWNLLNERKGKYSPLVGIGWAFGLYLLSMAFVPWFFAPAFLIGLALGFRGNETTYLCANCGHVGEHRKPRFGEKNSGLGGFIAVVLVLFMLCTTLHMCDIAAISDSSSSPRPTTAEEAASHYHYDEDDDIYYDPYD